MPGIGIYLISDRMGWGANKKICIYQSLFDINCHKGESTQALQVSSNLYLYILEIYLCNKWGAYMLCTSVH